jgi:hypothetical protein
VEVVETGQTPRRAVARPPAPTVTRDDVARFQGVVQRVEPVAERACRARAPRANCDFRIVVDDRQGLPVNAYQTLDRDGRPILAFTLPMLGAVRNADELAFVMGPHPAPAAKRGGGGACARRDRRSGGSGTKHCRSSS